VDSNLSDGLAGIERLGEETVDRVTTQWRSGEKSIPLVLSGGSGVELDLHRLISFVPFGRHLNVFHGGWPSKLEHRHV